MVFWKTYVFFKEALELQPWKKLSHGWNNRMENQDSRKLQMQEENHMFQEKCESTKKKHLINM
jgi:hypothetical protein